MLFSDYLKVYFILLILAPFIVCLIFNILTMSGERLNFIAIFAMMIFGYLTILIWPTYILALILVPIVFEKLVSDIEFVAISTIQFRIKYACYGALAGVFVLSPLIFLSSVKPSIMLVWITAGSISGAISLTFIATNYRSRMLS